MNRYLKWTLGALAAVAIMAMIQHFVFGGSWHPSWTQVIDAILIAAVPSSVVIERQMRKKIKDRLRREATDLDYTSLDTWMKVEAVERTKNANKPLG